MVTVRPATLGDLAGINEIYNHYIRTDYCTFDLAEHDLAWRQAWFAHFAVTGPHRLIVAVDDDRRVLGYAYSAMHRERPAYATSIETSVYIAHHAAGKGIGRALYEELFRLLSGEDLHRAYAGIALPNDASVALHERMGFRQVALFTEQGRKFDRYWDVAWFERALP